MRKTIIRILIISVFILITSIINVKLADAKTIEQNGDIIATGSYGYDIYQSLGFGWTDGDFIYKFRVSGDTHDNWFHAQLYYNVVRGGSSMSAPVLYCSGDTWVSYCGGNVCDSGNFVAVDLGNNITEYTLDFGSISGLDPNEEMVFNAEFGYGGVYPVGNDETSSLESGYSIGYQFSPFYHFDNITGTYFSVSNAVSDVNPSLTDLTQLKGDGVTPISEEETTIGNQITFQGEVDSSTGNQVKLQVELKDFSQPFNGQDLLESDFVNSGSKAAITINNLIPASYHWRARAVDDQGNSSDWQEFGAAGNVDFIVETLQQAAADLAKDLVNSDYLFGGKGWDFDVREFVAPETIKTGYNFWNQEIENIDFGAGVDCSGLIMWSYDRSFDPKKPPLNNFVKAEGADEQYRYNTESTTEPELKPGDVMFFDFNGDNFIDHVAMYVGESGGYDVVSAANRTVGIIYDSKNNLKEISGFVGFKRIAAASLPEILITAHSPVNLMVTDPDGFTITPTTTISSDEEYLREIPGVLYYSEMEKGADGNPIDQVYSYASKTGDYIIKAVPASNSAPTDSYSLDFSANGQEITLADNVLINQIPPEGYGARVDEQGSVSRLVTLNAAADTYLKQGTPNKNQGTEPILRIRDSGNNRALIYFDDIQSAVPSSANIISARIQLTITDNGDNWGTTGRTVDIHRLTHDWTELGATWNCGIDSDTSNSNDNDCNGTDWEMAKPQHPELWPYIATPTDSALIMKNQSGIVEYDVTSDVQNFVSGQEPNYGWIIRKTNEGLAGLVEFGSRETNYSPKLIIETE
jgi:cell wall-associated NlpC family hydrolase